ncbi:MAG: VPLPA-CTERM sorting domain-containing protein [Sedimenticola sp.]|nr:VPLPA-CTERM sorting domain-containing protein [Sedimenticola sp.]
MNTRKLCSTALLFSALTSSHIAQAFVALPVTAVDIDTNPNNYNYEIKTDCIGFCLDTMGGIEIPTLYKANHFYIPYFTGSGISNISSPTGWSHTVEITNDVFGLGPNAGVIHWEAAIGYELDLYTSLSGFFYTSTINSSVKAPFRLQYSYDGRSLDGDPPIPASPNALAAGLQSISTTSVPIPASTWLFGLGLVGMSVVRKRRDRKEWKNG